jgi:hypothetical protein
LQCLVPNNCGIIFEDTKEERESLWDRYCMQMPEQTEEIRREIRNSKESVAIVNYIELGARIWYSERKNVNKSM